MATRIVLAEDQADVRDTLLQLLQQRGFEVTAVANGADAEAAALQDPDLLILDLLLPKKQGFQVIESLRAAGKTSLKVMVISGVFKTPAQQKDAKDRLGVKEYLLKPFENDAFLNAVDTALGRATRAQAAAQAAAVPPSEPLPASGTTQDIPIGLLLFRAQAERHSGILELMGEPDRMRLFFYRGSLAFAQSNRAGRHVGAELVKRGKISVDAVKLATVEMGRSGTGLFKALLTMNLVDEATAREAYKTLVPAIGMDAVGFQGRFKWVPTEAFAKVLPAVAVSALTCLMEGLKALPGDVALKLLERRKPLRVLRGPNFDRLNPGIEHALGQDCSRAINGRARVGQIVEAPSTAEAKGTRARQLLGLICMQAAVTPEGDAAPLGAAPEAAAPPPAADDAVGMGAPAPAPAARPAASPSMSMPAGRPVMTPSASVSMPAGRPVSSPGMPAPRPPAPAALPPELVPVIQEVEARFAALATATHFDTLGIKAEDDAATVKKAYFALAGKFHTDKFASVDLGADRRNKVDAVFARIAEAYDVLSKPEKRAEYEAEVKLKAGGGSINLGAIFEAESFFTRAEHLLDRGDFVAANKLLDKALELDPKDIYKIYKMYTGWRVAGSPKPPVPTIIKDMEKLCVETVVPKANEFMAVMAKTADDLKTARNYFRKILEDPQGNKALANRELDAIKKRLEEDKSKAANPGGLMGKLFNKS